MDINLIHACAHPSQAGRAVVMGLCFLIFCGLIATLAPAMYAAMGIGIVVAAAVCFVMLVAMARSAQLSLFGVALGISADGAYAAFTDQTPVTVANALVALASSLTKALGIVAADAGVAAGDVIRTGVWCFILGSVAIMGASFLINHDD